MSTQLKIPVDRPTEKHDVILVMQVKCTPKNKEKKYDMYFWKY